MSQLSTSMNPRSNVSRIRGWVLALLAGATQACVGGPLYDDTIEDHTRPVELELYASQPGATITVRCAKHYGPRIMVDTFTAPSTPRYASGEDKVYLAGGSRVIPRDCWDTGFTPMLTFLFFEQTATGRTDALRVFDQAGRLCVFSKLGTGMGPMGAGLQCHLRDSSGASMAGVRLFARR
jgi:hypothetical protein